MCNTAQNRNKIQVVFLWLSVHQPRVYSNPMLGSATSWDLTETRGRYEYNKCFVTNLITLSPLYKENFYFVLFLWVCMCEVCHLCRYLQRPEEGVGSPVACVTSGQELPRVGAGNWCQVGRKSLKSSEPSPAPTSHLSLHLVILISVSSQSQKVTLELKVLCVFVCLESFPPFPCTWLFLWTSESQPL